MAEPRRPTASTAILQVSGLNVYYGHSHALQGVDLTLERGVLSVVGRNGMGKTTLCKTIMGLVRASSGSIRMNGQDLLSLQPAQIARLGVGYVPQGRRLWRSLNVDEHLRLSTGTRRGAWTVERIYDTFPRLAERKNNGGGQLSGGEQQMLAIARALLTNPQLLIMDEPTEGLAPVIVSQVENMLVQLGEEGDIAILVIEQNIGVATLGIRQGRDHGQWADQPHHRLAAPGRRPRIAAAPARRRPPFGSGTSSRPGTHRRATRGGEHAGDRRACGAGAHLHFQSDPADAVVATRSCGAHRGRRAYRLNRVQPDRRGGAAALPDGNQPFKRTARGSRGRHARYQGTGVAFHPRPSSRRAACERGWSTFQPAARPRPPT